MKRELSKDDLLHLKLARELESLVANPGWKIYCDLIRQHIQTKEADVWEIDGSPESVARQMAAKGAVLMGRLCLGIPSSIIQVAKEIRDTHVDEDDTTTGSQPVGSAP